MFVYAAMALQEQNKLVSFVATLVEDYNLINSWLTGVGSVAIS